MATCTNCGAEANGQYCESCGARVQGERPAKQKKETRRVAAPSGAANAYAPKSVSRNTILAVGAVALLLIGMLVGFYMGGSSGGGPLKSTAVDATANASGTPSASDLTPLGQAGQLMDNGISLMEKGDRAGAVAEFRKSIAQYQTALKADPTNLYARSYMGLTYYYAGDSKSAVDTLNAVLKEDPDYLWAIFNLAWIYDTAGKKPEALAQYQHYVAVADKEQTNELKYAEQLELIPQQIEAAKKAIETLGGASK